MPFEIENGVLRKYVQEPGVTKVTVPAGVTAIGKAAFLNCRNLTAITLPESVTEIRDFAFYGCSGITELTVPESVKVFGVSALRRFPHLNVIRLRADDPAMFRQYFAVVDLGRYLDRVFRFLRSGQYESLFSAGCREKLSVPPCFLHWLHTDDPELRHLIGKHLEWFMQICFSEGDFCAVEYLTAGGFFTAENIDSYIAMAQTYRRAEIVMLLLHYKNAYFGFAGGERLKL